MIGDKKKMAAAIVAKMHPAPEKEPEGDEMEEGEGLAASSADILSALESKDAAGLSAALKSFVEQCR
jgi:hypothetical protein